MMRIFTAEQIAAQQAEALRAAIVAAIDAHVEDRAKALGYNGAAHCASYVASTVPDWAAEAAAFITWRDAVWVAAFAHQAAVEAGTAAPTVEAALAALPEWSE